MNIHLSNRPPQTIGLYMFRHFLAKYGQPVLVDVGCDSDGFHYHHLGERIPIENLVGVWSKPITVIERYSIC